MYDPFENGCDATKYFMLAKRKRALFQFVEKGSYDVTSIQSLISNYILIAVQAPVSANLSTWL